jgi:hypothetical protein
MLASHQTARGSTGRTDPSRTLTTGGGDLLSSIGALNEKPLHLALKEAYACPGDRLEARVGPWIVDILRGDRIIEIQTANLAAIKRKMLALVETNEVLLVVPVTALKAIVRLTDAGVAVPSRTSPKRGAVTDVFDELVSFPQLIDHPRFTLEVALTREEEVRRADRARGWRRQGWVVDHRQLVEVQDRVRLASGHDLADLLPVGLADPFTTADLALALGRPRTLAQRMAYCLAKVGAVTPVGRLGNAVRYSVVPLDG